MIKKIFVYCISLMFLVLIFQGCEKPAEKRAEISQSEIKIAVGQEYLLQTKSISGDGIEWEIEDGEIASLNVRDNRAYAFVRGLKNGTTNVVLKCGNFVDTCKITVASPIVTLDKDRIRIDPENGEKTATVRAEVINSDDKTVDYISSNRAVADVSPDGVITAKRAGRCVVVARHKSGAAAETPVEVLSDNFVGGAVTENLYVGEFKSGHVQGIAIDYDHRYMYHTFTDVLVKTDLEGNVIGTLKGYLGHMGDCTYNFKDGRLYASLSVSPGDGYVPETAKPGAYVCMIDVDRIDRPDMDCTDDGRLMRVVYMPIIMDYTFADVDGNGKIDYCNNYHSINDGKYGVIGIDAMAFGPSFGPDGGYVLTVPLGSSYGDCTRTDDDYQVVEQFDVSSWWYDFGVPYDPNNMPVTGPGMDDKSHVGEYFLHTGAIRFGVQNLEYDTKTGLYLFCGYGSVKSGEYPSDAFIYPVMGNCEPKLKKLEGFKEPTYGMVLPFAEHGKKHEPTGIRYYTNYNVSTGLASLGDGTFYISFSGWDENKGYYENIHRVPFETDSYAGFNRFS